MAKLTPPTVNAILPDLGDLIFLGIFYLLFWLKPTFLFADASIGWHLAAGDYILSHHIIPVTDLFSYTFATKDWVNYEWLIQVIMAGLVKVGGLNLLGVMAGSVIASIFLLLYLRCRQEGCHFLVTLLLVLVGEIASSIHWLARPHLVTLVGVFLFYTSLEDFYSGATKTRRLLFILLPFMLFWVNCHPGFLFGLGIMIIYLVSAFVEYAALAGKATEKEASFTRLKGISLCTLMAVLVTLVNPYGFRLYLYISNYLKQGTVLAATNEFQSPVFHGDVQSICLEVVFAFLIVGLAIGRKPIGLPTLLMVLAFGHFSLANVRNVPLFIVVALPVICKLLAKTSWSQSNFNQTIQFILEKLEASNIRFSEQESQSKAHLLPILTVIFLCAISLNGGKLFGLPALSLGFGDQQVPSTTLAAIKALQLDPQKGFNYDNWGGYINYKLGIRVFIDDRADFYGDKFYTQYGVVCETSPGWANILDQYHIDWILFPTNSTLVMALKERGGWKLVASDPAASLFVRSK